MYELDEFLDTGNLPLRSGRKPETNGPFPHSQVSGQGPVYLGAQLLERVKTLPGVTIADSLVSVPGALAFHLDASKADGPTGAFVQDGEFGHLHPPDDGSIHLMARPEVAQRYLEQGWGEPHPVVPNVFLVFGPRDESELEIVWAILRDTYRYATGS